MKRNGVRVGLRLLSGGMLAGALALTLGLLAPGLASAHAYAVSSDPPIGSTVKTAPSVVTVTFAENVNPQGSDIVILDVTGKQVSTAPAQVSRTNEKMMTVPMGATADGVYLVQWHTVSADDGDPDIGAFNFTVDHTAKVAVSTPAPTTTPGGSGGSSGTPIWLTVVLVLLGLAVGGSAGYALARRAK